MSSNKATKSGHSIDNAMLKSKILALYKSYASQRIQLELNIESSPKGPTEYTKALLINLSKEEHDNYQNSKLDKEFSTQITECIKNESDQYFQNVSRKNISKWKDFIDKLKNDRANNNTTLHTNDSINIPDEMIDLEIESKRLELDYNENWLEYESFHIEQAFKSQLSKIDLNWDECEANLLCNFNKAKSTLIGTKEVNDRYNHSVNKQSSDPRWHHAEKQKTLIHTAPVISPSNRNRDVNSFHKNTSNDTINEKINQLEKALALDMNNLAIQKFAAYRWCTRNKVKFLSQANAIKEERKLIAKLLAQELKDYQNLKSLNYHK